MQILQIIDSLEVNGGSTMFLETVSAMHKYFPEHNIIPYVVSKTGKFGRKGLVDDNFAASYGICPTVLNYDSFTQIAKSTNDAIIFHHVLGHTRNIKFNDSCKYFVVNHTLTNIHRLKKFKCSGIISVCKYFANMLKSKTGLNSKVILNGCDDYFVPYIKKDDKFIIGCCQRVVPSKFNNGRKVLPPGCIRYIVGPCSMAIKDDKCRFFGPVFDRQKKMDILRNFDVYLHDTTLPEGASMALLESLSNGIPVLAKSVGGGTQEIIRNDVNGYFYSNDTELYNLLCRLSSSCDEMNFLRESTRRDFLNRLHIKYSLEKYKVFCG